DFHVTGVQTCALPILLITLVGYLGSTLITDRIKNYLEKIIKRTPLISVIYGSIKDLITAFVGQKKSFSKPVMVKLYENSKIARRSEERRVGKESTCGK